MKINILVFDTETNDKPKNPRIIAEDDLNNYPYILQLGFLLFELDSNTFETKTLLKKSIYIQPYRKDDNNVDNLIPLNSGAFKVHGISLERCKEKGIEIAEAIYLFQGIINQSNVVVAHNFNFDRNVITSEALRLGINLKVNKNTRTLCTMLNSVEILKLPNLKMPGSYKWPSLAELYKHLFNKDIEDIYSTHDALNDVEATKDCLIELCKTNKLFNNIIKGNAI
jgi:DNA polymerase III epsilon subunit-like protein